MRILRVKSKFEAAHHLNEYNGACSNLHGHTWEIEIYVLVKEIKPNGISIDFKKIKRILKSILPDHKYLNDIYNFNPTAENIVEELFRKLKPYNLDVKKIVLWESESNGIEYTPD